MVTEVGSQKTKRGGFVSKRLCVITTILLSSTATVLLVLLIMALNGSLPVLRDRNYVRPFSNLDMTTYSVVNMTMRNCRDNLPMTFRELKLRPDPLFMPDSETSNLDVDWTFDLKSNMTEEVVLDLMVQRLEPPWTKIECEDGSGSCRYTGACDMIARVFKQENCASMKPGTYTGTKNQIIDLEGPFQWATPGNYYAQVKLTILEQALACVGVTFRIVDK